MPCVGRAARPCAAPPPWTRAARAARARPPCPAPAPSWSHPSPSARAASPAGAHPAPAAPGAQHTARPGSAAVRADVARCRLCPTRNLKGPASRSLQRRTRPPPGAGGRRRRDATRPVSTGGGTRRVQLVREGEGGDRRVCRVAALAVQRDAPALVRKEARGRERQRRRACEQGAPVTPECCTRPPPLPLLVRHRTERHKKIP